MQTIGEFISEQRITADPTRVFENPAMADMGPNARHWQVKLTRAEKIDRYPWTREHALVVPFSQGSAHKKAPTAADVLDCLASDSAGAENARSFEEWAGEYGYDADSRQAKRIFKAVVRQAVKLREFLGAEAYERLLWEVERA
jgi:hypothetical protein